MYSEHAAAASLTRTEAQVLELVAVGSSAKEVAIALGIAPRTVEKHLDHMRLKMRARNRTHMVARAMTCGMLGAANKPVEQLVLA